MSKFSAALLVSLCVAGCGGGSSGTDGTINPPDTSGTPNGLSDCQNSFSPERVAAGEDCKPARSVFCPSIEKGEAGNSRTELVPCSGVEVTERTASGGGFSSRYYALRRSSGTPQAIYLALHYLGASTEYFANLVRLTELAKGRNLLILVPQAPSLLRGLSGDGLPIILPIIGDNLVSRWPTNSTEPVEDYVDLLDGVVADARSQFGAASLPLYVGGLSNGASMALNYACARANAIEAVMVVAGAQNKNNVAACQFSRPIGTIIVHGTNDPLTRYSPGLLSSDASIPSVHDKFEQLNGCSGSDNRADVRQYLADGTRGEVTVHIDYSSICSGGRRSMLVTLVGGGHNWPGEDVNSILPADAGLFGHVVNDFDATLQGFDLMRRSAGL